MSKWGKTFCNRTLKIDTMYLSKNEVKPITDYLLHLTFENGEKRKFDMKPYLNIGILRN